MSAAGSPEKARKSIGNCIHRVRRIRHLETAGNIGGVVSIYGGICGGDEVADNVEALY